MSMVLPHEHKPVRLPVVPATLTALLDTMSDGTIPVPDNTTKRAFLCRDPAYPLWVEKSIFSGGGHLQANGTSTSWQLPNRANSTLMLPQWDYVYGVGTVTTIDGAAANTANLADITVIADTLAGTQAIYIPPNSVFCVKILTLASVGAGSGIEFETISQIGGEEYPSTFTATATTDGYLFTGIANAATSLTGTIGEGNVPSGFTYIRQVRTTATAPTAFATPVLQFGWCTGGNLLTPTGTALLMVPYSFPPEFGNSTLPYGRTRLNSSAALFTNVTAALSKEGTVLAARLKPTVVDPWSFATANLNSVHPTLRYFGPLEKGLYTFTTPSGNLSEFNDSWMTMGSNSTLNATQKPLFQYRDIGVYNAMLFSDLGSSATGTQLAVSCYAHLEFETSSSLFTPGVSTMPLEMLHAAEVALLSFGHFHENPTHWMALAAAAKAALRIVAPMVAPYARQLAQHVVDKGVMYLNNRNTGDRSMRQAQLVEPRAKPPARKQKAAKAKRPPQRKR